MLVYVINNHDKPLMPCTPRKAKRLLKTGKAKVLHKTPFTIKLLYGSSNYRQQVIAGMDTGSGTIGIAAQSNGKTLYQGQIEIRNDIKGKMEERRSYRRTRRGRKTPYREARFMNRGRKGFLSPTVKSKIDSHLRVKKQLEKILPVTKWIVEVANFDIHKISNPKVSGIGYQNGRQKDYYNTKQFVLSRDSYTCRACKAKQVKLHVHHIIYRSSGGSNTPNNLITLCEHCHDNVHKSQVSKKIVKKFNKLVLETKYTASATQMNIIISQLKKVWKFKSTYGYITKYNREKMLLSKHHYYDALAICMSGRLTYSFLDTVYFNKHVSRGDYKRTFGSHSEKRFPKGKLFGMKKFDYISTLKGTGFVKGRMSIGYFVITLIDGTKVHGSAKVKTGCKRLRARTSTLVEKRLREY